MMEFEDYISEDNIIFFLAKARAKLARERGKKNIIHQLSTDEKYNYHRKVQNDKLKESGVSLENLLPPRRSWKKIGQRERYRNGQLINSVNKNVLAIIKTIKWDKKNHPEKEYLKALSIFIADIKEKSSDPCYYFDSPKIYPILKNRYKKEETNICRPISIYSLKEKVLLSAANKYFTDLFDSCFSPDSFAFRSCQIINGRRKRLSHHDAFQTIIDYKKENLSKELFVSECDMMKFYDTVNHTVIKKRFQRLLKIIRKTCTHKPSENAIRIFYRYLDSYTFTKNVYPLNNLQSHFNGFRINNGEYGWVEKELIEEKYYKTIKNTKIGIPQGGALSGLIANI